MAWHYLWAVLVLVAVVVIGGYDPDPVSYSTTLPQVPVVDGRG